MLSDLWNTTTRQWNLSGEHIVKQQDFWYVMFMTFWIALPWICTRRVPVEIELVRPECPPAALCLADALCLQPSNKVAVLRFERGMQQGLLARISRSAVKEYHAFGIISYAPPMQYDVLYTNGSVREGTHAKYHYLVCGVQGLYTRSVSQRETCSLGTCRRLHAQPRQQSA